MRTKIRYIEWILTVAFTSTTKKINSVRILRLITLLGVPFIKIRPIQNSWKFWRKWIALIPKQVCPLLPVRFGTSTNQKWSMTSTSMHHRLKDQYQLSNMLPKTYASFSLQDSNPINRVIWRHHPFRSKKIILWNSFQMREISRGNNGCTLICHYE